MRSYRLRSCFVCSVFSLTLATFLSGCTSKPENYLKFNEGDKLAPLSIPFDRSAAISAALGGSASDWKPHPPKDSNLEILKSYAGKKFNIAVILDAAYTEAGVSKHLLVLGSSPADADNSCHACGVLISAFTFRSDGSGWPIEAREPYLLESGSFGSPPNLTLTRIGSAHTGFTVVSGYTAQGETTGAIQIFAVRPPHIVSVLQLQTLEDDTQTGFGNKDARYEVKYTLGPTQTNGFFDIHLSATGQAINADGPVAPHKPQICKMQNASYHCAAE